MFISKGASKERLHKREIARTWKKMRVLKERCAYTNAKSLKHEIAQTRYRTNAKSHKRDIA
jgi:hypothetical protein